MGKVSFLVNWSESNRAGETKVTCKGKFEIRQVFSSNQCVEF